MPVIDDTIYTLEIKRFKEEVKTMLSSFEKRLLELEAKAPKGK